MDCIASRALSGTGGTLLRGYLQWEKAAPKLGDKSPGWGHLTEFQELVEPNFCNKSCMHLQV